MSGIGTADFGVCTNCGGTVTIHRRFSLLGSVKGGTCQQCGARYRASQALALEPRPGFTLPKSANQPAPQQPQVIPSVDSSPRSHLAIPVWFYRNGVEGEHFGPLSFDEMSRLIDTGIVKIGVHVWHDGMQGWEPIETTSEFSQRFAAPQVTQQPSPAYAASNTQKPVTQNAKLPVSNAIKIGAALLVAIAFVSLAVRGLITSSNKLAAHTVGLSHKAVSETAASQIVGGFTQDESDLYHLGLQHIANVHGKLGSFTIGQVIDQERAREGQRSGSSAPSTDNSAATAIEQKEVAEQIHPSDLVKSFTIVGSKLGLVIDRDMWDGLSHQDKKLFFGRIEPIWDAIYAKHNPGSTATSDVMLFDLNQDMVTDNGNFTVYGK